MSARKFAAVVSASFVILVVLLLMIYSSGVASAGLTAGFLELIDNHFHFLLVLLLGVWSSRFRKEALLLLPISCLLMFVIGGFVTLDIASYPASPLFILAFCMLFALIMHVLSGKWLVASAFMFGSIMFQLGVYTLRSVPEVAAPLYYMLGYLLAMVLVLALGISVGVIASYYLDQDQKELMNKNR